MIKKIIYSSVIAASITLSVVASANEKILKKNDPTEIKDCHEGFNRAIFAVNKGLDNVIFEPVARVYRVLPSPVRSGVSNSLDNLSNLVTIPNNVLQGEFRKLDLIQEDL